MKTIIVYYSFSGNNKVFGQALQSRLACEAITIKEARKRSWFSRMIDLVFNRMPAIHYEAPALENYDLVICIAPIWAARIAPPLMSFLKNEKDRIRKYAFTTLCGGVAGQKEKLEKQLLALMEKAPEYVSELWISSLLNGERAATGYQLDPADLAFFEVEIARFLMYIDADKRRVSPTADPSC